MKFVPTTTESIRIAVIAGLMLFIIGWVFNMNSNIAVMADQVKTHEKLASRVQESLGKIRESLAEQRSDTKHLLRTMDQMNKRIDSGGNNMEKVIEYLRENMKP